MDIKQEMNKEVEERALQLASIPEEEYELHYNPDMTEEEFKQRYAGVYQKDKGKRMSEKSIRKIWNKFIREERVDFFKTHTTFSLEDIMKTGFDKFIYTMGWTKPAHVKMWRNNKVRVGMCCHCKDQFIPLMFQYNQGLCEHCKPLYSIKAIRNFITAQLNSSERYFKAQHDLLMDFYIVFYNDKKLRELFLVDSDFAKKYEAMEVEVPEWVHNKGGSQDELREEGHNESDDSKQSDTE